MILDEIARPMTEADWKLLATMSPFRVPSISASCVARWPLEGETRDVQVRRCGVAWNPDLLEVHREIGAFSSSAVDTIVKEMMTKVIYG